MTNVLLGKVMKAMYKMSGKTISELADETGLTIDTINNIFYARLQKPGLLSISELAKACGFTVADLYEFVEQAEDLPENAHITDEFTKFILKKREGNTWVGENRNLGDNKSPEKSFSDIVDVNKGVMQESSPESKENVSGTVNPGDKADTDNYSAADTDNYRSSEVFEYIREMYEDELKRCKEDHRQHVEELREHCREEVHQMEEVISRLKAHYDHSVGEIQKMRAAQLTIQERENRRLRFTNYLLLALILCMILLQFVIMLVR